MLRIRKTRWKVAYFVVGVVLIELLSRFVVSRVLPDPIETEVGQVLAVVLFVGASRTFRGRGEPIVPPRVWWRATARPTASYVIAATFTADALIGVLLAAVQQGNSVLGLISSALLAAFFFNSAIRLQRFPQPKVPDPIPLPRFKRIKR